jgi:hypothetical protein
VVCVIRDWQIQHKDGALILGLATDNAVMDIVSSRSLLAECLALLHSSHVGSVHTRIGNFGEFEVTLNLHHDDRVSIFIDGPAFDRGRVQSAAIWVDKQQLVDILDEITRAT